MPSTLENFTLSAVAAPDDFIVGYDTATLNGERRWTVSTIANAVSGITNLLTPANFTGANQSLTANGWQKLPGGLIIQWINANTFNASFAGNFPIAFPNAFLVATVSEGNGLGWINAYTVYAETGNTTRTQLHIIGYSIQNGGNILVAGNINFNAIAIGY